jgi:hypothetical protein
MGSFIVLHLYIDVAFIPVLFVSPVTSSSALYRQFRCKPMGIFIGLPVCRCHLHSQDVLFVSHVASSALYRQFRCEPMGIFIGLHLYVDVACIPDMFVSHVTSSALYRQFRSEPCYMNPPFDCLHTQPSGYLCCNFYLLPVNTDFNCIRLWSQHGFEFEEEASGKTPPHAAQLEIIRAAPEIKQASAISHTVTFDCRASGHLVQQTEITEVSISAEDLAILGQDPDYLSLPDDDTLNFKYFEQAMQNDSGELS